MKLDIERQTKIHLKVDVFDKLTDIGLNWNGQGLRLNAAQLNRPEPVNEDDDHNNPCGLYDYGEGKYSNKIDLSKHFNDYLTVSSSFGGRLVCFPFKVSIL